VPEAQAKAKKARSTKARSAKPTAGRAAKLTPDLAIVVRNGARSGPAGAAPLVDVAPLMNGASKKGMELVELKTLVRDELAPMDVKAREAALESLVASAALDGEATHELSVSLHAIREVLRERLPLCAVSEDQPAGLAIDEVLAIDERSYWIKGWMHDEDGLGEVTVVSPEGARASVSDGAFRFERPDVAEFYSGLGLKQSRGHGFTAKVTLPGPSLLQSGWLAELRTSDGVQLEIPCPSANRDPVAARTTILAELGTQSTIGSELTVRHGRPALTRLQEQIVAKSEIESVDDYGEPPANPGASIVVPLYKRLDFIEHQLLHFSRDPEFAGVELVYVLDSTEQAKDLAKRAHELFGLYGLPFRVVNLTSSAGFAGANNHGIAVSRAKRLLLLNSDVIPDRPGWIGSMAAFYEQTPQIGALGPKLLYEDDSLQHAGLYFYRSAGSERWENAHCFKGLHRTFPAANVTRSVPAVTAACMMIDREAYEEAGGLPLHYVQGDYEDSELCLRLADTGRTNWYLPSVELYHLEGQSYVPGERRVPSEYNMWLHSTLWGGRIEELMAEFDPNDSSGEIGDAGAGREMDLESS
jgi:GT2 family glycosyltransferase